MTFVPRKKRTHPTRKSKVRADANAKRARDRLKVRAQQASAMLHGMDSLFE